MTSTSTDARRGGRGAGLILAVVAIIAMIALVLYMSNDRAVVGGPAVEANSQAARSALEPDAERAAGEAANDTANLAEGARELASDVVDAAEGAAATTSEAARASAQAVETAVERSTDGNPDSDNNER
jgi:Tfp pilus assembly protein PilE